MGRRSKAPEGWISLYRVAQDHKLGTNTELVALLCARWGYEVRRFGGVACMRIADVPDWELKLGIWRTRDKLYGRRPLSMRPEMIARRARRSRRRRKRRTK